MSEQIPDDLGTGIPPIGGKSMQELVEYGRDLEVNGTNFDDLTEGQSFSYISGEHRFSVKVLGGRSYSRFHNEDRPLVAVERVGEDGEVLDSSGGMLLGVSLTGDGNFPMLYLPPEGSEYVPFIIETLSSPDEQSSGKLLVLRSVLPS